MNKFEDYEIGDEVIYDEPGCCSWDRDDIYTIVGKDTTSKGIHISQKSCKASCWYHDLTGFKITKKKNKQMKTGISSIVSGSGAITAVINGKSYTILPDSMYYAGVKLALKSGNVQQLKEQFDLDLALKNRSNGKITFENGVVKYNGAPIHNGITKRINELMRLDFPFEPLLNFLENVLKNPSQDSREELYGFLEKNSLPITEDGCFLAWKKVTGDFLDIYTKKISNRPGQRPKMDRALVNPNRDQTCSKGLHVCSESYLSHYGVEDSNTVVLVKVNPKDVVSVPTDYNNAKMRVCEYLVLQEVKDVGEYEQAFKDNPVYSSDVENYGVKPTGQRYYARRDSTTGRFVRHT